MGLITFEIYIYIYINIVPTSLEVGFVKQKYYLNAFPVLSSEKKRYKGTTQKVKVGKFGSPWTLETGE